MMLSTVTRALQVNGKTCIRSASQGVVKSGDSQIRKATEQSLPSCYTLNNDLRVACFSNDSELSSTAIHVEAGTRNEAPNLNGVSNFIARLAGKGTSSSKFEELQMKLSKIGATLDVQANREYTSFVVSGFSKDSLEHAQIVSDVVKNSIFDENAINKERENILADIERDRDNIPVITMDYLYSVAFEGTPMGYSLPGPSSNIKSISRKEILDYINNNYKAPRMLLTSVGGRVDLDKLAEAAEKNLGDVSTKYPGSAEYPKPCRFTAMEVQHRDDDLPLAHVAMGFNGCSYGSPDRIPLMLLTEVMGSHDKSHGALGQGLNRMGKVTQNPDAELYSVHGFSHFYSDCGLFGTYYVASPEALYDAGIVIAHFWRDQCLNLLESNLIRAQRTLRRKLIEDIYNPVALQNKLAKDILFGPGRPESVEESVAKIESVTRSKLQDIAYDYINDSEFARAAYGPTEAVFDYNQSMDALRGFRW